MLINIDVAVIGGGPAGLAAAIEAEKNGASTLILERNDTLGGILQQCIHNGFGLHYFGEELTGPEYAQRFCDMLKDKNITVMLDTMVLSINDNLEITAVSRSEGMVKITAKSIVLAMGCRERTRGAINISGTRPAGIYAAGTAQYLVNMEGLMPGREVVILGSGDIGMIMARRMTWEGANVKMVCELMPFSSGLMRNRVQCLEDFDIPLLFSTTITKIHGKKRVEAVTIAEVDENLQPIAETEKIIPCDTLLLSVGLIPENELSIELGIEMDNVTSGAVVDENRQTSIPGIFACGNVLHVHDLVDNVSDEAAIAGRAAAAYALNAAADKTKHYNVKTNGYARYCVPQKISLPNDDSADIDLYFRVSAAIQPARLTVTSNGEQILTKRRRIMTPGEMEKITIPPDKITGDIILTVEEA